ncbi:hypothetical protein HAX54_021910 [Datura stramonium]|uniref:Uncharacterized protein n=1 Tax=Datura stramonium TaxID=4076 RepID=A0ABS8S497_DATST|nr:hypothetical protein [Datura stramonium]
MEHFLPVCSQRVTHCTAFPLAQSRNGTLNIAQRPMWHIALCGEYAVPRGVAVLPNSRCIHCGTMVSDQSDHRRTIIWTIVGCLGSRLDDGARWTVGRVTAYHFYRREEGFELALLFR